MVQRFEWDSAKAAANLKKHGVGFSVAMRVFADPFAMVEQDRIEYGERRWQTLGLVDGRIVLLVAHTVRDAGDGGEIVRIVSARRADAKERRRYEQNRSSHA